MLRHPSRILIPLLFFLSMVMPTLVAQVPESTSIAQRQQDTFQLVRRGKENYNIGQFEGAAINFQQAAEIFADAGDWLNQGMALSNVSLSYQQLGQWELAKQDINKSLKLLRAQPSTPERSRILAQTLDIQGKLQREVGQPEDALKTWQEAAEIYTQIDNKTGVTQSQINQVLALQDLGLYPRACKTLLAALELEIQDCQKLSQLTQKQLKEKLKEKLTVVPEQPASLLKVQGLRNLGEVLRVVGEPIQSEIVLEASLGLARQLEPSPDRDSEIAAVNLSLGNTLRVLNNTQAALKYYEQAIKSAPATTRIQSQLNQLSLLVETQQWSQVKALWSEIDSELNKFPASRTKVYAQINLAQSLMCFIKPTLTDKDLELSSPLLQQCSFLNEEVKRTKVNSLQTSEVPSWKTIEQIVAAARQQARSLGDKKAYAYALGYLGGVYQQVGKFAEAQKYTQQALESASAFDAPNIAYLWQWQLGRLFKARAAQAQKEKLVAEAQELWQRAIASYSTAFENLKSLQGDLLAINPEIQFTFRDSVEPVYREYVDLLLQPEEPSQENLKQAREVIEALELAELNDFFREACIETKPEQIDEVVAKAKSPMALLYTIILKDRIEVILALSGEKELKRYATKIPQDEVKEILVKLRQALPDVTQAAEVKELSQKVYNWLIRPVQGQLAESEIKTLVFVLDGPLSNIPMAVLYDSQRQEYLVEKEYAIAVSLGLQLLSPPTLEKVKPNALIGGLSEEIPLEGQKLPPLTNVPYELDEIKSALPSVELINADFNQKELEAQIKKGKFTVLHMATYGQFSSDPEDNFILLWDKRLRPKDLTRLLQTGDPYRPTSIELLVLNASETASSDYNKAALGLAGIAIKAGTPSTLGPLWSMDDLSMAEFMSKFYKELKKPNVTKAEALKNAQLAILQEYRRPYFWAPYIIVGNWL